VPKRLFIHLGDLGARRPEAIGVGDLPQAINTLKAIAAASEGAAAGGADLTYDLLAAPVTTAPSFHHVVRSIAFVSNCTAAYLMAQVDETFLVDPEGGEDIAMPRFAGSLSEIQESLVAWVAERSATDFLARLEQVSGPGREERHRRLALLRGHLTAMRWAARVRAYPLAELEARISSLIARETRAWV